MQSLDTVPHAPTLSARGQSSRSSGVLALAAGCLLPLLLLLLSGSPVASALSTDNRWSILLSGGSRPAQTLTLNDTSFPALLTVSPGARRPRTSDSRSYLMSGSTQVFVAQPFLEGAGASGVQGVASDTTLPPTLIGGSAWTGADGELYLYGGRRSTVPLDALWRYSRATSQWTWLRGSNGSVIVGPPRVVGLPRRQPNATATPGGRAFGCTVVDPDGNTWLVGGAPTFTQDTFSDIWMLNGTSLVWTQFTGTNAQDSPDYSAGKNNQIDGSTQRLGSRQGAACWWAKGALYIFGGQDKGLQTKNDMSTTPHDKTHASKCTSALRCLSLSLCLSLGLLGCYCVASLPCFLCLTRSPLPLCCSS
jgi:hypothetical protein